MLADTLSTHREPLFLSDSQSQLLPSCVCAGIVFNHTLHDSSTTWKRRVRFVHSYTLTLHCPSLKMGPKMSSRIPEDAQQHGKNLASAIYTRYTSPSHKRAAVQTRGLLRAALFDTTHSLRPDPSGTSCSFWRMPPLTTREKQRSAANLVLHCAAMNTRFARTETDRGATPSRQRVEQSPQTWPTKN